MNKNLLVSFCMLLMFCNVDGQVLLNADGPGDTYELISSVLAPGYSPFEVPDCNHEAFGEHIDEVFDEELNDYVFRFYMHVTPDNDRCIKFDRQRNEIKSYDKSPDNLLGIEGEKVVYKWKFKLPEGFQSSPNFTHIHQLKSVGGDFHSTPMYTLTTRKGSPDQLELRYALTNNQVTLQKVPLAPFIGSWLEVTETIIYGTEGFYNISIMQIADEEILFEYMNDDINNWRPEAEFVRPKWGIYRSLNNAADLRDEAILYADFSVEELVTVDNQTSELELNWYISLDYDHNGLRIHEIPENIVSIEVLSLGGQSLLSKKTDQQKILDFDIQTLDGGTYVICLKGPHYNSSQAVVICK